MNKIVKNSTIKYRSSISSIILLCYLFIFSINIFHFHNLEIETNHNIDLANESYPQGQSINSEFQCVIHQSFNSLHTFNIYKPTPTKFCLDCESIIAFYSDQAPLNRIIPSSNQLRAPPSFS
jgi:hypothetical protein